MSGVVNVGVVNVAQSDDHSHDHQSGTLCVGEFGRGLWVSTASTCRLMCSTYSIFHHAVKVLIIRMIIIIKNGELLGVVIIK